MACQSPPSVDDLVRLCELSDEDLNKEITRDIFHEIGPSLLEWRLLAPILKLTHLDVEDIERDTRGEELKRSEFLSVWKRKQCVYATYRALVVALCKIERREDAMRVCEVLKGELYISTTCTSLRLATLVTLVHSAGRVSFGGAARTFGKLSKGGSLAHT